MKLSIWQRFRLRIWKSCRVVSHSIDPNPTKINSGKFDFLEEERKEEERQEEKRKERFKKAEELVGVIISKKSYEEFLSDEHHPDSVDYLLFRKGIGQDKPIELDSECQLTNYFEN